MASALLPIFGVVDILCYAHFRSGLSPAVKQCETDSAGWENVPHQLQYSTLSIVYIDETRATDGLQLIGWIP